MNPELKMDRPGDIAGYGTDPNPEQVIHPSDPEDPLIALGLSLVSKALGIAYVLLGKDIALIAFAEGVCRAMFSNGMSAGEIQRALTSSLERTATSIEQFNANEGGVRDMVEELIEDREGKHKLAQCPTGPLIH